MRLANLIGWPKELFSWNGKDKLHAKLKEIGVDGAVKIAMLATVAGELSVNEYNTGKADRLEAVAQIFAVDTATVRKDVDRELKEKGQKKAAPKTAPAPTASNRFL